MNRKTFDLVELGLLLGIVFFLNIIFKNYFFRLDLTQDKRYTIAPETRKMVQDLDDVLYIEVFLTGSLTPDYERLHQSIQEKLSEFKTYGGQNIVYRFTDPNGIEEKEVREQFFRQLVQKGVQYRYERIDEGGKVEEKLIFPSALISYHGKEIPVSFMKGSKILPLDQQLNQSVEGVEYELVSGLRKLNSNVSKSLAFVEGQGELSIEHTAEISSALSEFYDVSRIELNDSADLSQFKTLIIAGPTTKFDEKEKFLLDQYVVNGGSLLVVADALNLNPDSLMNGYTFAFSYNTGIEDLLFKYGVRMNQDLIEDLNCALIKVATGNGDQTETVNWPFYPIIYNFGNHPIVKNLDAIVSHYAGSVDTVKAAGITKTPLLITTSGTKIINAPARLDLNDTRKNTDPSSFNKGTLSIAYLLEGDFESYFKNLPSPIPGKKVAIKNKKGRIIVCADSDIIKNEYDAVKKKSLPLGYDPNIQYEFSNKDFILHSVDYLMYEDIINLRNKEVALRPLDKVRISEEKFFWQLINIVVPVALVIAFGIFRIALRKRKYEA